MNYPENTIIPFYTSEAAKAQEKEKTVSAIKYQMAVSILLRLLRGGEISESEFDQGRTLLAQRFGQESAV